jgi:cytochrome P450
VLRREHDTDFADPAFRTDPFPLYEEIRAIGNVVWNRPLQGWVVVGYDEATAVLADSEGYGILSGDPEHTFWFEAPNMITTDGELHARLRSALSPLFTRRAVARWEARITEVVQELLTPLFAGGGAFDLFSDFSMLPTVIVAEMLGVPAERYDDFRRWSHDVVANISFGFANEENLTVLRRAATEVNAYLRTELDRHRRTQPDDLLTHMLNLTGDDVMSDDEIRSTAVLLLLAGYDTTAKTMSSSVIALERHPDQRRLVADDPALLPAAVEESLRWFGSVHAMPRRAVRNVVVDGMEVAAGDMVYVCAAAANRDPRRWPDPNRFDVKRELSSNLAFGYGPHLCLGAPLARLETKVALGELLRLAPEYRLDDVEYGTSVFVRGPDRGMVTV